MKMDSMSWLLVWQTSLILLQFNIYLFLNIAKQILIISTTVFRPELSTTFIKDINRKEEKMSANIPVLSVYSKTWYMQTTHQSLKIQLFCFFRDCGYRIDQLKNCGKVTEWGSVFWMKIGMVLMIFIKLLDNSLLSFLLKDKPLYRLNEKKGHSRFR